MTTSRNDPGMEQGNPVESANRKLIRPSLTNFKEQQQQLPPPQQGQSQGQGQGLRKPMKRPTPPEQTNAENFYYVKQMQSRTPMVVVMADGEELQGIIEWYDRGCIKFNRLTGPNLLIYKSNIKYLYKQNDKPNGGPPSPAPAQ